MLCCHDIACPLSVEARGNVGPWEVWLTVGRERARLGSFDSCGEATAFRRLLLGMLRTLCGEP